MWLATLTLGLLFFLPPDFGAEGMKALEEQRYEAALQAFTKAIASDPKDYSAHFHLALANSMLKRPDEAVAGYRKTLELKPGLYEAQLNLGIVLLQQQRAAEALPLLEDAVRQKPQVFRPSYYLGEAALASGRFADAERNFKTASAIDPKSVDAQLGLARALAKQNRFDEAAPIFDAVGGDAPLELASLYEAQKQPEKAIAIYRNFPGNAAARERMGELLLESGKAADALPHLEAAVAASPTAANRYALATAYILAKQVEKAAPLLAQAVESEPKNPELRMMYGRALREMRNFNAAAEQFYHVAQARPESAEAWGDLAGMLILLENYPAALGVLDKLKALGAEKPAHHYLRAIILDKSKMFEPALASYEKFLSMSDGKSPDEEFKARQRARILRKEIDKK